MADDWYEMVYENKHKPINEFIKRKQVTGRSERILNAYSRILKKFYHEEFSELRPEDMEVSHIEDYVMRLTQRDLSQNTRRRYLESFSMLFSYVMKRPRFKKIAGNPAAVVLEEIPKQVRDRPDCATWENGRQIIHDISDPGGRTVAIVLAKTGCRLTEALKIQANDLMLEERSIRLHERKGGKQTIVPIGQETIKAIQRLQFIRNGRGTDYLFVSIRGERVSKISVQRAVKKATEEAGIVEPGEDRFHKKFTSHTYRTVFITLMRNQGMPDHILYHIRGDSNDETVDIHTHVDRSQVRQQYLNCIKTLELQTQRR